MNRSTQRAAFIASAVASRQRGEQLDGTPDDRLSYLQGMVNNAPANTEFPMLAEDLAELAKLAQSAVDDDSDDPLSVLNPTAEQLSRRWDYYLRLQRG